MTIDCLVAEIGSTTTIVNAFDLGPKARFLGRGVARTSVETDVREGLGQAIEDLRLSLGEKILAYDRMVASSSAAGGLRMTVHGLVREMTVKAARQAALNAGANIHLVTAGPLERSDLETIKTIKPNIIVIAGGTDHGEKDIPFENLLKVKDFGIPVIYAGNIANHERIMALNDPGITIVKNVYPRVDDFNIMPLREAIYKTFETHIVHAKGMAHVFEMVDQIIIPTPGAVMDATMLFDEIESGVVTLDVGGATTDVHSVCDARPEYALYLEGEPRAKRTVEGDLGVYVNRLEVLKKSKPEVLARVLEMPDDDILDLARKEPFIPKSEQGLKLIQLLTQTCVHEALDRHTGDLRRVFTTNGIKVIPEGRDLSMVKNILLTGGALLYHPDPEELINAYVRKQTTKLIFDETAVIRRDKDYIMAAIGVLSHVNREAAITLLRETLGLEGS